MKSTMEHMLDHDHTRLVELNQVLWKTYLWSICCHRDRIELVKSRRLIWYKRLRRIRRQAYFSLLLELYHSIQFTCFRWRRTWYILHTLLLKLNHPIYCIFRWRPSSWLIRYKTLISIWWQTKFSLLLKLNHSIQFTCCFGCYTAWQLL